MSQKFTPEHSTKELSSPVSVGDLESFKKQACVLKEGVEYRIKISFRVRILIWKQREWNTRLLQSSLGSACALKVGLC